jgi:hypothetical protein
VRTLKYWYWEQNPDVAHAGIPSIRHWFKYGRKEGRAILPPFWYVRVVKRLNQISFSKYLNAAELNNFNKSVKYYNKIRIARTNFYQIDSFIEIYFKDLKNIGSLNILFKEDRFLRLKKSKNKVIINLPKKSLMTDFEIELLSHLINVERKIYLDFESIKVYDNFIGIVHKDLINKHEINILSTSKNS